MTLLHFLSGLLLLLGGLLCVTGALGLLRFPDFFTRMHAASITDTFGSGLIIAGLILLSGWAPVNWGKLLLIFLFILITSPTASHALAVAALHGGLKPLLGPTSSREP